INVTLDPQTVHVKIPISIQSKQVSINLKQKGTSSSTTSNLSVTSDVKTIRVYGTQDQIDAINSSIDVPVDVSDVNGNTKKSINLADALGNKVAFTDPDTIDVSISTGSSSSSFEKFLEGVDKINQRIETSQSLIRNIEKLKE